MCATYIAKNVLNPPYIMRLPSNGIFDMSIPHPRICHRPLQDGIAVDRNL